MSKEVRKKIIRMYKSGSTVPEISRNTDISDTWVRETLKAAGVYKKSMYMRPYGFYTGNGYLLFEGNQAEAMEFFGKARKTISRYVNGETSYIRAVAL